MLGQTRLTLVIGLAAVTPPPVDKSPPTTGKKTPPTAPELTVGPDHTHDGVFYQRFYISKRCHKYRSLCQGSLAAPESRQAHRPTQQASYIYILVGSVYVDHVLIVHPLEDGWFEIKRCGGTHK